MTQAVSMGAVLAGVPKGEGRIFARYDINKDGKLSLDEFKAVEQNLPADAAKKGLATPDRETLFAEVDADGDGGITRSELKAFHAKQLAAMKADILALQEQ